MWYRKGRPLRSPDSLPDLQPIEEFESRWVEWWSLIQPEWRDTSSWPFAQEEPSEDQDWGSLPNGGKDGLFLVVITLGWWVHAQDPSDDSRVDDAIEDVTWVLKNLISVVTVEATNYDTESNCDTTVGPGSSPAPEPRITRSSASAGKRPSPLKIGPPSKRVKRLHA